MFCMLLLVMSLRSVLTSSDDDCMAVVIEAEDIDLTGAWMAISDPDAIGGE